MHRITFKNINYVDDALDVSKRLKGKYINLHSELITIYYRLMFHSLSMSNVERFFTVLRNAKIHDPTISISYKILQLDFFTTNKLLTKEHMPLFVVKPIVI